MVARVTACSLEITSQISQPASSVFLSQKTSQQYFQPARSAQANRLRRKYWSMLQCLVTTKRKHGLVLVD
jgi:hypothetical protein